MSAVVAATLLFATTALGAQTRQDSLAPLDQGLVVVNARSVVPAKPDIYGTVAIEAGVTAYNARWRRVSAADETDPRVRRIAASAIRAASSPEDRLEFVQVEVGSRIRWKRDLDTYKISDYWAQAGETLTRGEGDSEDIAILKMQILKAAGVPSQDIYLSVGRDTMRGADTLLLVRVGNKFYSLDDRDPRPMLATDRRRFTPMITLGRNNAWVHGRRVSRGLRTAQVRANAKVVAAR